MYDTPSRAQGGQVGGKNSPNLGEFGCLERQIFSQFGRTVRAVQIENRFAFVADDMDVRRPVIVRIDHCSKSVEA
jgi:hypothetical protein